MEQEYVIELNNVCLAYEDNVALRFINLKVKKGECIVVQGPNGCGKSTLMKLLNGLIFADEGEYLFNGSVVDKKKLKDQKFSKKFHKALGYVFQNSDIQLFCQSVWDEVAFAPRQMNLSEEEVGKRTADVIELLGISKLKDRAPYHLSGGEKRKVALASVLSVNPDVLVMDEPFAGLDSGSEKWLTQFLLELKDAGKTLVISTHNDQLAETVADRIIRMNDDHEII